MFQTVRRNGDYILYKDAYPAYIFEETMARFRGNVSGEPHPLRGINYSECKHSRVRFCPEVDALVESSEFEPYRTRVATACQRCRCRAVQDTPRNARSCPRRVEKHVLRGSSRSLRVDGTTDVASAMAQRWTHQLVKQKRFLDEFCLNFQFDSKFPWKNSSLTVKESFRKHFTKRAQSISLAALRERGLLRSHAKKTSTFKSGSQFPNKLLDWQHNYKRAVRKRTR